MYYVEDITSEVIREYCIDIFGHGMDELQINRVMELNNCVENIQGEVSVEDLIENICYVIECEDDVYERF